VGLQNDYYGQDDQYDQIGAAVSDDVWTVAEAKSKFSEVLDRAGTDGPQTITRNGRKKAVIVSAAEWDARTKRKGNLAEFLMASPLRSSGLKLRRRKDYPRPPKL
jgi:prevent-host-death family protein